MSLKILKSDKSCPGAAQMIDWLKGVFDALDKKYVRLCIFFCILTEFITIESFLPIFRMSMFMHQCLNTVYCLLSSYLLFI